MEQPPRNRKERLLNPRVIGKAFFWYGMLASVFSIFSYFFVNLLNGWPSVPLAGEGSPVYVKATTMTLAAIVFCQVGAVFNCRTERQSVFRVGLFSNRQVNFGIVFELFLILALIFLPPLQFVFQTRPIDWSDLLLLCAWPPLILLIEETRKALARKMSRKNPLKKTER